MDNLMQWTVESALLHADKANARRDSMGRYASRGYGYESYDESNNGSYNSYDRPYDGGYSRDEDYERLMRDAKTEKERSLIRQLMEAHKN